MYKPKSSARKRMIVKQAKLNRLRSFIDGIHLDEMLVMEVIR